MPSRQFNPPASSWPPRFLAKGRSIPGDWVSHITSLVLRGNQYRRGTSPRESSKPPNAPLTHPVTLPPQSQSLRAGEAEVLKLHLARDSHSQRPLHGPLHGHGHDRVHDRVRPSRREEEAFMRRAPARSTATEDCYVASDFRWRQPSSIKLSRPPLTPKRILRPPLTTLPPGESASQGW